jgi:hypothetical protein
MHHRDELRIHEDIAHMHAIERGYPMPPASRSAHQSRDLGISFVPIKAVQLSSQADSIDIEYP